MALDAMTLRRLLQARPDLAEVLGQGTAAPTLATAPTAGGFTPAPPADILSRQGGQSARTGWSGFMPESLTRGSEPADLLAGSAGEDRLGGGLWDRVKGFFGSDEPVSEEQQRYDDDVSSAGWAGASQAAAEAASNPNLSPIQVLTQALAGYSGAKQRAKSELRGEAREQEKFEFQKRGLESEIGEREAKALQRQRIMARVAEIGDPVKRRLAEIDPEAFVAAEAKAAFPDPVAYETYGDTEGGRFAYNPLDPTQPPIQLQAGTGKEPKVYGGETGGYFILGPNGPETVKPGVGFAPQEGPEVFGQAWSPEQVAAAKLPPGTLVQPSNRGGYKYNLPAAQDLPNIGDLQALRASLPEGSPERAEVDQEIKRTLKGRAGTTIRTAGGDVIDLEGGSGAAMDLSQPNLNKVQETVVNAQEQLGRLAEIENAVKPEFMRYGPRVGAFITSEAEKLGFEPSTASKQQLADITTFRSNVINNLNAQIKEQSGLSMTEGETKRTQLETPNENDSATQFSAKANALTKRLKNTILRKQLLLMNGIQFDPRSPTAPGGIEIDNVPEAINAMGTKIEQDLIAAGVPAVQAKQRAAQELRQKLGI